MSKICPKCKSIAEYNAYYGRITCTRCSWESEPITRNKFKAANIKSATYQKKYVKA